MTNIKTRKLPWILIGMLMISTIFYSATSIRPVSAQTTAVLFVDPPTAAIQTQPTGAQFSLNISIANITGLVGLEFDVNWTAGAVDCLSITENLFATLTPVDQQSNIWNLKKTFNNTEGTLVYAQLWQDLNAAQAGGYAPANITEPTYPEGKLAAAIINFNVTQIPDVGSYVDVPFIITVALPSDALANQIPIDVVNATYRIYGPPSVFTNVIPVQWNSQTFNVTTVSNETVIPSTVIFVGGPPTWSLAFNVTGNFGDIGYVNVTIPKGLMDSPGGNWTVNVNGAPVTTEATNDTMNTYLYFVTSIPPTEGQVTIIGTIPEFAWLFIPLLMTTTLIAYALRRRRRL